jgi:hypothetical protein
MCGQDRICTSGDIAAFSLAGRTGIAGAEGDWRLFVPVFDPGACALLTVGCTCLLQYSTGTDTFTVRFILAADCRL